MVVTPVLDGLLLIDKPTGVTSFAAVAAVRRALSIRRVGHTGTLDPLATGLIIVLFGSATRLARFVPGEPKTYTARIRFGSETDTDDSTGVVVRSAPLPPYSALASAIAGLTGPISQLPPAFSAKQQDGVRAYRAARRGAPLQLAPVTVQVYGWHDLSYHNGELEARVSVSSGTYIRALARDLGRLTGSAAHLSALRRVAIGPFMVSDATPLSGLDTDAIAPLPPSAAVPDLPRQQLTEEECRRVLHGRAIPAAVQGAHVALFAHDQSLVAIGTSQDGGLHPHLVLAKSCA